MEDDNETQITEFILLGFAYSPQTKTVLFVLLLVVFLVALAANSLFVLATLNEGRLHSPMYFFLCNLACLDLCFSSIIAPTVLQGLLSPRITIAFSHCLIQMCLSLSLGTAECLLLAVIAWDRYVAICNPLLYPQIIDTRACIKLAVTAWATGFLYSLPTVVFLPFVHFCGHNILDHTFCEFQPLQRLACKDISSEFTGLVTTFISVFAPLLLIVSTYVRIVATILRMPTAASRQRTFTTCGSHLVVVCLFYVSAMVVYMKPKSAASSEDDKSVALFYASFVPALNPLIYTLRNREVKRALMKLCTRIALSSKSTM